jgi:hypothetical protein
MNDQEVGPLIKAVYRANLYAIRMFALYAVVAYYKGHDFSGFSALKQSCAAGAQQHCEIIGD